MYPPKPQNPKTPKPQLFEFTYFCAFTYQIFTFDQQQPLPLPSSLLLKFAPLSPPSLLPGLSFFLSSALMEFCFLISALVISKNASSTPEPDLADVLRTFKLCVYSKAAISSSVTSISRSWSSSSSLYSPLVSTIFYFSVFYPTSALFASTITETSVPQCFSISFSHPSTLMNDSLSVKSKTTRMPSAPL